MSYETFVEGSSPIHKLNPQVKILATVFFSFTVALSSDFTSLGYALCLSIALMLFTGIKFSKLFKRLVIVNAMVIICWILLPLTMKGDSLATVGVITFYQPGVELAGRILLKSYAIVLVLIGLISTISVSTMGQAMDRLKVPKKLTLLLLLTYRYLFVLEQEYKRLVMAAKLRCFKPGNNLHTYRTYAYLVGMLLVRASLKGEQVYKAMICRGFKGEFKAIQEFPLTLSDLLFAVLIFINLLVLGFLEWGSLIGQLLS